jgi:DNA (cytosine-5)-methyltransferase 1
MNEKPGIVDLFSGCGGFGLGAELAGFHTLAAIDIEPNLQSAYSKNFPTTNVVNADISKMNEQQWAEILGGNAVDGVIGGPPCQGYSRMGHSDATDPRRSLLRHFYRTVNILKPKFFIMENVEGLMDEKNVYELKSALKLVDKKYTVLEPIIIDASKYGAPTKRKRVIVIGYLPKYFQNISIADFTPPDLKKVTVKDAISDLPSPLPSYKNKDGDDFGWHIYPENTKLSEYALKLRLPPPECLGWQNAVYKHSEGLISGFLNTKHSLEVSNRYSSTTPGSVDKISKSKRLAWEGLCPTLRAGTGSDKGSHQAVRPLHPEQGRVITVREAARLQGFPDWFVFHNTKWHSFRMIGNSVSPIVSEFILTKIKSKLTAASKKSKVS